MPPATQQKAERQVAQANPKLLALKGLPASGKTTYARELVAKGWVRVNKDDLRAMLHNSKFSRPNEAFVLQLRDEIIIRALVNEQNVVVDDTNLDPKHADQFKSIAGEFMADYEEKFFDTPVKECIKRNALRENPVPEKVIYQMYNKYIDPPVTPVAYDDSKEECIIVDVDGTLAHIADGRSPYDASRAMNDEVDDAVSVVTAMMYEHGYKVIVLTGRDGKDRQVTEEWLEANGIPYDELYTRAEGDTRKDSIIKEELYRAHVEARFNVKFVMDDRNQVVDMWRKLGLKCFQVAEGNF
jgi:predicted kinase/3-deoxy-D-manno-octulosonate 8-phosphate phosphatase KdsC-like HAD superfamily phosphatase